MAHAIALHIYFVCKLLHGFKQLKVLAQKSLKYHSNTQELVSQGVSKCKCMYCWKRSSYRWAQLLS